MPGMHRGNTKRTRQRAQTELCQIQVLLDGPAFLLNFFLQERNG